MKRIVHEEQSQREIQLEECIFRHWCEDFVREVMEPASELRTIEVRRYVPRYRDFERVFSDHSMWSDANQGGTAETFRSLIQGWKGFSFCIRCFKIAGQDINRYTD